MPLNALSMRYLYPPRNAFRCSCALEDTGRRLLRLCCCLLRYDDLTAAKAHGTECSIEFVTRRICTRRCRRTRVLCPFILLIHEIGTLMYLRPSIRRSRSASLGLQNLLLPIQPPGRYPPLLGQLLLLQPFFPFFDCLLGFFLRLFDVGLECLAGGDDFFGGGGVAGWGDDVF